MSSPILDIRDSSRGCRLAVLAKPRARRTEFAGIHDGALCVRLQAPPADGKANEELLRFLADKLGVPKAAVTLRQGVSSRRKVVAVEGVWAATISRCINALQTGE